MKRALHLLVFSVVLFSMMVTTGSAFVAPFVYPLVAAPFGWGWSAIAASGAVLFTYLMTTGPGTLSSNTNVLGQSGIDHILVAGKIRVPVSSSSGAQIPVTMSAVPAYCDSTAACPSPQPPAATAEQACAYEANWRNTPGNVGASCTVAGVNYYNVWSFDHLAGSGCYLKGSPPSICGTAAFVQTTTTVSVVTNTETRTSANSYQDLKVGSTPANGWVPDSTDPDTSTLGSPASTGQPVAVTGSDGYGNQGNVVVIRNADGTISVTGSGQTTDASGNNQVTQRTVQISSSGAVQTQTQVTFPGATLTPGTVTPTTQTTANSPGTDPSASGSSSVSVSNFPTDYARTGEAATAASTITSAINPKLDTLHTDLTSTAVSAPSDPGVRPSSDISGLMPDSTFSGLQGWALPARSVSCPVATFSVWSHSFTIDAHCTLWSGIASNVQAVMLAVWVVLALFVVLAA